MGKDRFVVVRLSEDQQKILEAKMKAAGFLRKSEYIRFCLFMSMPMEEKIDMIFKMVVENERRV